MPSNHRLHNVIIVGKNNDELIEDRQFILDHFIVENITTKQQTPDASIYVELLSNIYKDQTSLILLHTGFSNQSYIEFIDQLEQLDSDFLSKATVVLVGDIKPEHSQLATYPIIKRPLSKVDLEKLIAK